MAERNRTKTRKVGLPSMEKRLQNKKCMQRKLTNLSVQNLEGDKRSILHEVSQGLIHLFVFCEEKIVLVGE